MTDKTAKLRKALGIEPKLRYIGDTIQENPKHEHVYPSDLALLEAYKKALIDKGIQWTITSPGNYLGVFVCSIQGLERTYYATTELDAMEAALWACFVEENHV